MGQDREVLVMPPAPGLGMTKRNTGSRDPLATNFRTLQRALAAVRLAQPLLSKLKGRNKELATQLDRALIRCTLAIGEGMRRDGGNKTLRYRQARGEAHEALVALMTAEAAGVAKREDLEELANELDLLIGCLVRLTR